MKSVPQAVADLLYGQNARAFADLLTLYFASGTVRWSGAPTALSLGATTWSLGPPFEIRGLRNSAGSSGSLEIDMLDVEVYPGSLALNGTTMKLAALRGDFRGVRAVYERAVMDVPGNVLGLVPMFDGFVAEVAPASTVIALSIASGLAKGRRSLPNRDYQPACPYRFGDASCGVNLAALTSTMTVGTNPSISTIPLTASVNALEYRLGTVVVGVERKTIADVTDAGMTLVLHSPLSATPLAGSTITVTKGCRKARAKASSEPTGYDTGTCKGYGNVARFGGFPDVPRPESV